MSDNPFKPPVAAVADIEPSSSRTRAVALALPGALAIAWMLVRLPRYYSLVSSNAMNPAGMCIELVGMACLAAGLWRAWPRAARGRKSFAFAAVLMLGGLQLYHVYSIFALAVFVFGPFVLGALVAVAGVLLVRGQPGRKRA